MHTRRATHLIAGCLTAILACAGSSDPQEPADPAAMSVVRSGIQYTADTQVMESFPVQIATIVTVTNTGNRRVGLTFPDGCVVLLRAYHDAARSRLAWDQGDHVGCTMALVSVDLPPAGRKDVTARTNAADILRDELPDGEYWLEAVLRPDGRVVAIPAGSVELAVPRD